MRIFVGSTIGILGYLGILLEAFFESIRCRPCKIFSKVAIDVNLLDRCIIRDSDFIGTISHFL